MSINRKITPIHWALLTCAVALSGVGTLVLPVNAQAAVYKCTDASGNVSYNQTPCTAEEKTETLASAKSTNKNEVDCRIANNFARQLATRMRSGETSGAIFDFYGGIDAIPKTTIGIINYVYSHKGNLDTTPQRITALSAARCSAQAYGPVACDNFPYSFIAELGGCERASMSTNPMLPATSTVEQTSPQVQEGSTQALGVRTSANGKTIPADCKQDMQAQLSDLFDQMRAGQTANKQGQLETRRKQLREKLNNC